MKKLLLVLAIPAIIGCGDGDIECFPGTVWSDRAQGCTRYIPEDETMVGITITKEVPYAYTSGMDNTAYPFPEGDRVAPDHHIQKD